MSQSNRNPNQPQHLDASCPRGCNNYSHLSTPLTLTDYNSAQTANRSHGFPTTEDSSQFSPVQTTRYSGKAFNPYMMSTRNSLARTRASSANRNSCLTYSADSSQQSYMNPNEYSGRPFNPHVDISGNRLAANKESHLTLESEMARSKDYALERIRMEQAANCDNHTRAHIANGVRGRRLEPLPKQRRKSTCDYINAGRRVDLDKVYNYNMPVCSRVDRGGRPLDVERDVTFRRLNLPTPKQQRSTSCPTPLQRVTSHSSVQRVLRACPRPTPPVYDRKQQTPARSFSSKTGYPVASMRSQVHPTAHSTVDSTGIKTAVATTTTTRANVPQQTPTSATSQQRSFKTPNKSPDRSPDSTYSVPRDQIQPQESTNISHVTPDSLPQLDSAYGRTSHRSMPQPSYTTPRRPSNVTDQFTNTSLRQTDTSVGTTAMPGIDNIQLQTTRGQERSMVSTNQSLLIGMPMAPSPPASPSIDPNSEIHREMQRLHRSMDQSKSALPRQAQATQIYPTDEFYYYNASMFDEPSHYKRKPIECRPINYIDLTDETQYDCNIMNISSAKELPAHATHPQNEDCRRLHSWRIPPEDIICIDTSQQPVGADFDSTVYMQLPSSLGMRPACPPEINEPCEQPRASLFRCLAQKLSSTYNFLSSLLAPQKSAEDLVQPMDQPAGQLVEASDLDLASLYNAGRSGDPTYDLRNLFATQCNDTTTYDLNALFGTKTQVMNEAASIRECANAKRCGRVQFDSSDKPDVQDPQRRAIQKAEVENLINDAYCPGIIQDTIDGRDNFNEYSINLYLALDPRDAIHSDGLPIQDPMTLLEAFSKRIEEERVKINNDVKKNSTEETVDEFIQQHFADLSPSDLNRAIKSFLLSERLQNLEQVEKSDGTPWEAEVQNAISTWPSNTNVKIHAYTGRTKPTKVAIT